MKRMKTPLLLAVIVFLCSVCLTFSVASVSALHYTAVAVPEAENGILKPEDGQEWFRVKHFEDNGEYILTVKDSRGGERMLAVTNDTDYRYIWYYSRSIMTTSTAPRIEMLSMAGCSLICSGSSLLTTTAGTETGDLVWRHEETALSWHGSDGVRYLKYDADSDDPFTMTADRSEAAEVILYSRSSTLERCIARQPAAESYVIEGSGYPAPVFSAGLYDGVTADSIRWFADGEEQSCTSLSFTADCLTDQPAGVHSVSCLIEAHDSDGVHYRERSADAAFVIAKGVMPDSFMTFSDIHEEYWLISDAYTAVMQKTGGYIPSLVICTGDLVYGPTAEKDIELRRYFPQIVSQLGGLDTVYVAGNHDSAEATAVMSAAAELGAAKNLPAKGGMIFDGESAAARSGRSSRYASGILVYGINFAAAEQHTEQGIVYTYEEVIRDVDSFLKSAAEQYHGELVVISAHSGLHVIGVQPESVSPYQTPLYEWQGENIYNVDLSYELARTVNRYAEQYGMDILFLFGHDHSRGEAEMFLTDGDTLISPLHYADRSFGSQTLHFTYAHAGYLSSVIGCADRQFSFIYRDGDKYSIDLLRSSGELVRHREIQAKHPYEAPPVTTETAVTPADAETETAAQTTASALPETTAAVQTTTTALPETTTAAQTTVSGMKTAGADTGEHIYWLLPVIPAGALLIVSKKRHRAGDS